MQKAHTKLFSLGGIYALGSVAQNALHILLLPLYTSYLYPEDFAVVALLGVTVSLIVKIAITPINNALNRFYYKPLINR